jgi:hypothetical protein
MMRHKWNVRKSYFKIDVAVDMKKKKILKRKITSEEMDAGKDAKEIG